jgi:dihydrodipicolinate reductase
MSVCVVGASGKVGRFLQSNLTRRIDFALFMVAPPENDDLVDGAPAIVGRQTPSAIAHIEESP